MDSNLKLLISEDLIHKQLDKVAKRIEKDYKDKDLVILLIMKGALCLGADLIRKLNLPLNVEFIQCSSYGSRGAERGELTIYGLDRIEIKNRDVLVVDDIFDSGNTLSSVIQKIKIKEPRTIKSLVLLSKQISRTENLQPDYSLFDIPNYFVVGYGLDYQEKFRGLNGIYILEAD